MRNKGWEELISKVIKISNKHDIGVLDMDALYAQRKKLIQHSSTSSVKTTKSNNVLLKNTNYLLKSYIFNIKYTTYKTNLPF